MIARPCATCGVPIATGTRCADCNARQRPRPKPSKVSPRLLGYDTAHDRLSRRARKAQPFCLACGSTHNLELHHLPEAWARKAAGKIIRLIDVQVLCHRCNVAAGSTRPRGDTPVDKSREIRAQPKSRSHTTLDGGGRR